MSSVGHKFGLGEIRFGVWGLGFGVGGQGAWGLGFGYWTQSQNADLSGVGVAVACDYRLQLPQG